MQSLDIDTLRTFLACTSAASFAEAGERVHKSQSAVSMQMRRLEEAVGRPLFVKRGRRNHTTDVGAELRDYAERIVRLNDEALGRFNPRAVSGRLRVGSPDDYAEAFLPQVFARFALAHPDVEVAIECRGSDDLAAMVRAGELDIAIVTVGPELAGVERIHTEPLRWLAPPDRPVEHERPLPLAIWQPGCVWRALTLEALERAGIEHRIAYTGWNGTALMTTVRAGLAVTALPAGFMGRGLRPVPAEAQLPPLGAFDVGLVRSRLGPVRLVDAFRTEVIAAFARLGGMRTPEAA